MATKPTPVPSFGRTRPRFWPPFLSRLGLVVSAPILFLCALEGILHLLGVGKPTEFFIPDEQPGFFRTNPNFTAPFMPASFGIQPLNLRIRKRKEPDSVRVFVLGESAAQGIPDPDFGFAAQLRAQLKARYPGTSLEVFNLGITAIDSHVVYRIVRQVADFEPDLLVIYMGNNEVVGPYGPGCAYLSSTPPVWLIRMSVWVRGTRTGQLLSGYLGKLAPSGARAKDWKGMETFSENSVRGDDERLEAVYRNFSANLRDIVDLARSSGIRTILSTVVANLKDSAPFISLHRRNLSAQEAISWKAASDAGKIAWDLGDPRTATFEYEKALGIDPEFADTHFRLGKLAEELGDPALARKHYLGALHWDALRFRPDARMNDIIRRVAHGGGGAVLLDAARALGSDADTDAPLAGREILFDHVHLNWEGNFQMAQLLAGACAQALPVSPARSGSALDAAGCAAALGYTPEARLKMLQVVVQLMIRPPFTNQFTFSENQARLKREIGLTNALLSAPGAKAADIEAVGRALRLDPDNPSLAARLGLMESDSGDPSGGLSLLEKAAELEPPTVELSMRRAEILMRLRRFDDAELVLLGSVRLDEVYFSAARPLVELWTGTRQLEKGRKFFARALDGAPSNSYLRLEYANLLARNGDPGGAEHEARRIWDADPDGRAAMAALELLIRLYDHHDGAGAKADALTLEARPHQAYDYYNNLRLVRIYAERNDAAKVAECLQAVAASGPFDSAEHLDLAHRLSDLNRGPEMLGELAEAGVVAGIEGDESRRQAVNAMIGAYRKQFSDGQSR